MFTRLGAHDRILSGNDQHERLKYSSYFLFLSWCITLLTVEHVNIHWDVLLVTTGGLAAYNFTVREEPQRFTRGRIREFSRMFDNILDLYAIACWLTLLRVENTAKKLEKITDIKKKLR